MKSFTARGVCVLFLQDWWRTRDWPSLWVGIPALVGGIVLVGLFGFAQLKSPKDRSRKYLMEARSAHFNDELETADIFYKKALLEWPDDVEALLEAAVVADRLEDATRRDAILKRLVNEDAYPGAMLVQAAVTLGKEMDELAIEGAEALMREALEKVDEETKQSRDFITRLDDLRRRLALASLRHDALSDAIGHWKAIAEPRWEDRVDLALTYLLQENKELAAAVVAELHAQLLVGTDGPTHARRAVVFALGGDEGAVYREILVARRFMTGTDHKLAWADTAVRCFHVLRLSNEIHSMKLLEMALAISPVLPSLSNELLIVSGMGQGPRSDSEGIEKIALMKIVATGDVPVAGHLLAGLVAIREHAWSAAAVHFAVAKEFYRGTGQVLTQCGLLLATRSETYHESALKLGEMGARFLEGNIGTRVGHGKILLALGKWQEAIDWLTPYAEENPEIIDPLLDAARAGLAP